MTGTREDLTRLCPGVAIFEDASNETLALDMTYEEARALADRLERADADRAKVERVEALLDIPTDRGVWQDMIARALDPDTGGDRG